MEDLGDRRRHALAFRRRRARLQGAAAEKGINIRAITTSEIKFSMLIDDAYTELRCAPCTRSTDWTRRREALDGGREGSLNSAGTACHPRVCFKRSRPCGAISESLSSLDQAIQLVESMAAAR